MRDSKFWSDLCLKEYPEPVKDYIVKLIPQIREAERINAEGDDGEEDGEPTKAPDIVFEAAITNACGEDLLKQYINGEDLSFAVSEDDLMAKLSTTFASIYLYHLKYLKLIDCMPDESGEMMFFRPEGSK